MKICTYLHRFERKIVYVIVSEQLAKLLLGQFFVQKKQKNGFEEKKINERFGEGLFILHQITQ